MPETTKAIELFAGMGGFSLGAVKHNIVPIGFEIDPVVCATGMENGFIRIPGDVRDADPSVFTDIAGVFGSPVCDPFSVGGKGYGRDDAEFIISALEMVDDLVTLERVTRFLYAGLHDKSSLLAIEPLRWIMQLEPHWIALEQVPSVLPLWKSVSHVLERLGYQTAYGKVNAVWYGIPQTRSRAVLIANRSHTPVRLPKATHSHFHQKQPHLFDKNVSPWVPMLQKLYTIDRSWVMKSNYNTVNPNSNQRVRAYRAATQPAFTVTSKIGQNTWLNRDAEPVRKVNQEEALILQGFSPTYRVEGTQTKIFEQIGDAVPPKLAELLIGAAMGVVH